MNKNHRPQDKSKLLPKGWVKVTDSEAARIWVKSSAGSAKQQKTLQTLNQCMVNNCPPLNTKAYSNSEIATSNVSYTYDPNFTRLTSVSNNWGG